MSFGFSLQHKTCFTSSLSLKNICICQVLHDSVVDFFLPTGPFPLASTSKLPATGLPEYVNGNAFCQKSAAELAPGASSTPYDGLGRCFLRHAAKITQKCF